MGFKTQQLFFLASVLSLSLAVSGCSEKDARGENGDAASGSSPTDSTTVAGKKASPERVPVEVTTLKTGEISSSILLSSNLETEKMAEVYSRVQGIVEKIRAEEGDFVRKGQVLAELDAAEYELAEAKAKVKLQQQQSAFSRSQEMYEKNLLSKEEFEQARFNTDAAEIEHKQAQLNLQYTRITAPISGVIGERLLRVGDRIQPADKLFSVVNTDEIIAVVYVPEKEIGRIHKGQEAFITSDHLQGRKFKGIVKRVSPVVDPSSGTFKVTIGIGNAGRKLRPGMFVNVHIITETHTDAVLVPKTAVVYENEQLNVFVVRDSIAKKVTLKRGFETSDAIESLAGLQAGDKVIVVGQAGLKDETPVRIINER
ncbi:MAG TPA: efflux RND transporter periplasmic adaptor subunit [Bacteroidetes bacterium]|nr:efflux RND transporter periplasmic adaptor subunit [Bacteroidota bacterium]